MIPFNPKNWYFLAEDGRVFSTARMSEVAVDDASYVAFRGMGLTASPWPDGGTEADVRAVLAGYGYPCAPITRRQFYQQAAAAGLISQAEALAVLSNGTLPATLAALVSGLPADQQFGAKMELLGGADFNRNHPLSVAIGAAQGMTPTQIDAFFQAAAQL